MSSTTIGRSRPCSAWSDPLEPEELVEIPGEIPRTIGPVGDHGVGRAGRGVDHAPERHAGVVAFEPHDVARRMQVEAEPVPPGLLRPVAPWSYHLGHALL